MKYSIPNPRKEFLGCLILGIAFVTNVILFIGKNITLVELVSSTAILTLGLLSNRKSLKLLGILAYLMIVCFSGFPYPGWSNGPLLIAFIFAIDFLYPKEDFGKRNQGLSYSLPNRKIVLILIIFAITVLSTFLAIFGILIEFGIQNNAILLILLQLAIVTCLYFLHSYLQKSYDEEEEKYLIKRFGKQKKAILVSNTSMAEQGSLKLKTQLRYSVSLIIVESLFLVSLIVLLLSGNIGLSFYYILFLFITIALLVFFQYNRKTILTVIAAIVVIPVFGYVSNPFRLGAKNMTESWHLMTTQNKEDYSEFDGYLGELSDPEDLLSFRELVTVSADGQPTYSGIWYQNDFDLKITYQKEVSGLEFQVRSNQNQTVIFDNIITKYEKHKDADDYDLPYRYLEYYQIGELESERGKYSVYLKVTNEWLEDYKKNPDNVEYKVLIFDSRLPVSTAYVETN